MSNKYKQETRSLGHKQGTDMKEDTNNISNLYAEL